MQKLRQQKSQVSIDRLSNIPRRVSALLRHFVTVFRDRVFSVSMKVAVTIEPVYKYWQTTRFTFSSNNLLDCGDRDVVSRYGQGAITRSIFPSSRAKLILLRYHVLIIFNVPIVN